VRNAEHRYHMSSYADTALNARIGGSVSDLLTNLVILEQLLQFVLQSAPQSTEIMGAGARGLGSTQRQRELQRSRSHTFHFHPPA